MDQNIWENAWGPINWKKQPNHKMKLTFSLAKLKIVQTKAKVISVIPWRIICSKRQFRQIQKLERNFSWTTKMKNHKRSRERVVKSKFKLFSNKVQKIWFIYLNLQIIKKHHQRHQEFQNQIKYYTRLLEKFERYVFFNCWHL